MIVDKRKGKVGKQEDKTRELDGGGRRERTSMHAR